MVSLSVRSRLKGLTKSIEILVHLTFKLCAWDKMALFSQKLLKAVRFGQNGFIFPKVCF